MKIALFAASAFAALAGPAAAQQTPTTVEDIKVNQLIVYGADACPAGTADEIIVCARKPETERYRIPEDLRDNPNAQQNQSWANKAIELSYVGRSGIGSCSPVGSGGASGCYEQIVREARAERASRDAVNWNQLIEEARQERLSQIDAEAKKLDQQLKDDDR